ncbi:hypothetical protein GO755_20595 [Spirosoma sp. HMF4905]|uniref:Uncharacterized protein n=1 Tax=Spirosoma arboris TaxID=2682092 RepID=A0A7K1SFW6_9BACT|nr:hypothetical protein [Spirosoma arboris]MVM32456.1 hypothetical protein [Spirosoma arboris]
MKFLLPLAADTGQTGRIYNRMAERLQSLECAGTTKRVYKVDSLHSSPTMNSTPPYKITMALTPIQK